MVIKLYEILFQVQFSPEKRSLRRDLTKSNSVSLECEPRVGRRILVFIQAKAQKGRS